MSRLMKAVKDMFEKKKATAKEMVAVSCLIVSCGIALGRNAKFRTRAISRWTTSIVNQFGVGGYGEVSEDVREEFWMRNLDKLNGQEIRKPPAVFRVDVNGYSDAGGFQLGGFVCNEFGQKLSDRFKVPLTELEVKLSSTV